MLEKPLRNIDRFLLAILAAAIFACVFIYATLVVITLKHERQVLFQEKVNTKEALLDGLAFNAIEPLLVNNVLALNALTKQTNVTSVFSYVRIKDATGNVRAYADRAEIGNIARKIPSQERGEKGNTNRIIRPTTAGEQFMVITRPISHIKTRIGEIQAGFSLDAVWRAISREQAGFLGVMLVIGLLVFAALACFAVLAIRAFLALPADCSPNMRHQNFADDAKSANFKPDQGQTEAMPVLNYRNFFSVWEGDIARNQVSVVSIGIKDFKTYTETKDPQDLVEDFNEYFSVVTETIDHFGGYVDKFIGDAVVAVFGNSPMRTDHAVKAVQAALAMQGIFHGRGSDGNRLLLQVGIGISSGVVLAGHAGSQTKKGMAFIGESFKTAYSLNMLADPGEIVISRDAQRLLEYDRISVEPLPPREILQRTQSWESFRLSSRE